MSVVNVKSISIKDLFLKKLVIPEYQRPYVWTKTEIEKLLFQFSEHIDREGEKPNFYLGSIVLHKDGDEYNIIDGQQRITTMQILQLIKNKQTFGITYDHPLTQQHIKDNYSFFKDKEFKLIDFESINVTLVITESEDMAYNFFETLNTGGKRLTGTDILKAHHLRSIKQNQERNFHALNWENKQKNLDVVNRMLSKIRRMDFLNRNAFVPNKFTEDSQWKNILTEDFADKAKKDCRDIGYSFVEIEENTHTITADKYAIRQPLNEGVNYINYLLSFTEDYNYLFTNDNPKASEKYVRFNTEIINYIDGTVDLRYYYQLALLSFVDRFGRKNVLEFSLYLFRFIYSIRLNENTRVYEATVRNFITEKLLLDRILNAFTYEEILSYIKNYKFQTTKDVSGVKQRFLNRVSSFFGDISSENFSSDLAQQIENYLNK